MDGLPTCQRPGHLGRVVVRDGFYGASPRRRQRFRCRDKVTRDSHRFVAAVPRLEAVDGLCETCENPLAVHEGPSAPRSYIYTAQEIAKTLIAVGTGSTYQIASEAARDTAGLRAVEPPLPRNGERAREYAPSGDLAANWTEVFGPVVTKKWEPASWPEVLILDSTSFYRRRAGANYLAFHVLGAYGYASVGHRGQLWRLAASPANNTASWVEFLESMPGTPAIIVADQASQIIAAVTAHWPDPATRPEIVHCVWHMANNAKAAFARHGIVPEKDPAAPKHELLGLLATAFRTPLDWIHFSAAVRVRPELKAVHAWLDANESLIRRQIGRRVDPLTGVERPRHESNGPLESAFAGFRKALARRAQGLTNRERTNLLLDLIRLHLNGQADERTYAKLVRAELERRDGVPKPQLTIRDRRTHPTL